MREVNDLKIGEGYLIYGEDVRKFKARYIPPANSVKFMSLMKFIKRSSRFLHERVRNAIEETRRQLDIFTAGVYRLYEKFAVGMEEERIHREYVNARNTLYMENVLSSSAEPYEIFDALEKNRYFRTLEDQARNEECRPKENRVSEVPGSGMEKVQRQSDTTRDDEMHRGDTKIRTGLSDKTRW